MATTEDGGEMEQRVRAYEILIEVALVGELFSIVDDSLFFRGNTSFGVYYSFQGADRGVWDNSCCDGFAGECFDKDLKLHIEVGCRRIGGGSCGWARGGGCKLVRRPMFAVVVTAVGAGAVVYDDVGGGTADTALVQVVVKGPSLSPFGWKSVVCCSRLGCWG